MKNNGTRVAAVAHLGLAGLPIAMWIEPTSSPTITFLVAGLLLIASTVGWTSVRIDGGPVKLILVPGVFTAVGFLGIGASFEGRGWSAFRDGLALAVIAGFCSLLWIAGVSSALFRLAKDHGWLPRAAALGHLLGVPLALVAISAGVPALVLTVGLAISSGAQLLTGIVLLVLPKDAPQSSLDVASVDKNLDIRP